MAWPPCVELFTMALNAVADSGFPVGEHGPRRGEVDCRGGYVSKIVYVEMKESGPLGGRAPGTPPSRSANAMVV